MLKYIYLGGFPPPYGGVTVKNKLLFEKLEKEIKIKKSGFYNSKKSRLYRTISLLIDLILTKKGLIIGLSRVSLKKITFILYLFNKKLMNNSIVMVMGGTFHEMVLKDRKLQKALKQYKNIFIETEGMKQALNSVGISNVTVFPNCRESTDINLSFSSKNSEIRCLFFSQVSREKGVDDIMHMAKILDEKGIRYSIDFFGEIVPEYKAEFNKSITSNKNLRYCGVFKSNSGNELYKKLNSYDVLLFPTKWKTEGVPGVLVEAKIAGLPSIVSDVSFNSEIVENGKTGTVLKQNTPEGLADAIEELYIDRDLLVSMKENAKDSSQKYIIDNYIKDIVCRLENNSK